MPLISKYLSELRIPLMRRFHGAVARCLWASTSVWFIVNTSILLRARVCVRLPLYQNAGSWLKLWATRDYRMSHVLSWKAATLHASRNEATTMSLLADDCSRFDIPVGRQVFYRNVKSAAVIRHFEAKKNKIPLADCHRQKLF